MAAHLETKRLVIKSHTLKWHPQCVTMATLYPIMSGLPVVISTVCQWKLITRLNALHP